MATCQICGREIKDNSGVIAHHGYTRPGGGWQTSSCLGARYQAYELSSDRIPVVIGIVETYAQNVKNQLKNLLANPPATITFTGYDRKTYTVEKPADFDPSDTWGGMRPRSYASAYSDKKRELEQAIKSTKADLLFLKERLANWVAPTVTQAI